MAGLAKRVRDKLSVQGKKVDPVVDKRVKRGRDAFGAVAARRKEAREFARNNHYVSIDKTGLKLTQQSTVAVSEGGKKPNHRVRRSHDLLAPILKGKVSAATQRIPGYEVTEGSGDPEDYSAARVAEKVLVAGYDLWRVKDAFRRATWIALVEEEAFVMPYWDSSIGPFIEADVMEEVEVDVLDENQQPTGEKEPVERPTGEKETIGMGDVRMGVYSGSEVVWEPGVQFDDSRWYAIDHARPKDTLEADPEFIGGELTADADTSALAGAKKAKGGNLVMVTEYLERPCAKYPNGRRIVYANGREIFPEEDYPLVDHEGNVIDRPCLHRLYYAIDGDRERARGLVTSLVETIRSFDYFSNKAAEYIQLVLTPQLTGPEGAVKGPITDEPGAYLEIDTDELNGGEVKWRELPSMPREFDSERNRAEAQLGYIANDNSVPSQVESAKAIGALAQKDVLAWQDFMEDLADCHAGVGRDALCLVQLYYTEQRMVKFRGRTGWESIPDFKGADIRSQTDVRVKPGSLEPITRAAIEQRIMNANALFPGYFPPEIVLAALSSGDFDRLTESFQEDEAQAHFIISQIRAGTFWGLPKRRVFPGEEAPALDPETGAIAAWAVEPEWEQEPERDAEGKPVPGTGRIVPGTGRPAMLTEVEGWMPRPFDGISVIRRRIEMFMKSDEWRHLDLKAQEATAVYYDALLRLEAQKSAKEAAMKSQMAERLGAENAAKPQPPKPMPSLPSTPSGGEEEAPAEAG